MQFDAHEYQTVILIGSRRDLSS